MSPLPSPEERRKQLRILGLEPIQRRNGVVNPNYRPGPGAPMPGYKSAAADERAEQRKEGRRRSKQLPRP